MNRSELLCNNGMSEELRPRFGIIYQILVEVLKTYPIYLLLFQMKMFAKTGSTTSSGYCSSPQASDESFDGDKVRVVLILLYYKHIILFHSYDSTFRTK